MSRQIGLPRESVLHGSAASVSGSFVNTRTKKWHHAEKGYPMGKHPQTTEELRNAVRNEGKGILTDPNMCSNCSTIPPNHTCENYVPWYDGRETDSLWSLLHVLRTLKYEPPANA